MKLYRLFKKYNSLNQSFFSFLLKVINVHFVKSRFDILWNNEIIWTVDRYFQSSKNPYYFGISELEEFQSIHHFCQAGDIFFDVGANVGLYSLYISYSKKMKCIQFEPNKSANDLSFSNFNKNNLTHLTTIFSVALSEYRGLSSFSFDSDINNKLTKNLKLNVEVKIMDDFISMGIPKAIKIDAEGEELAILKGARAILSHPHCSLLIIESDPKQDEEIKLLLSTFGFQLIHFNYMNNTFTTGNHLTNSGNYIFLKTNL